jgi:predicted membrane protein DUF2207
VEGGELSRGLRRELAAEHHDRFGGRATVPLEVVALTRNGAPEPWSIETAERGDRITTGPLEPGRHVYELQYRTALQVGYFPDHDELYWSIAAADWPTGVEHVSAEVMLPQPVAAADLRAEAYTGPAAARGRDYQALIRDGAVGFTSTTALRPNERMAIVVGFPKGVVDPPPLWERAAWFFSRNARTAAASCAVLALVGGFLYRRKAKRAPGP